MVVVGKHFACCLLWFSGISPLTACFSFLLPLPTSTKMRGFGFNVIRTFQARTPLALPQSLPQQLGVHTLCPGKSCVVGDARVVGSLFEGHVLTFHVGVSGSGWGKGWTNLGFQGASTSWDCSHLTIQETPCDPSEEDPKKVVAFEQRSIRSLRR